MKSKIINNRKLSVLVFLFFLISAIYSKSFMCKSINNNLFNQIIEKCDANVVEYGVSTSFQIFCDGKKACNRIFDKLNFNIKNTVINKENLYCIEFKDTLIKGYIENTIKNNKSMIFINITKKDNYNNLISLKESIENAVSKITNTSNNIYFTFLKAKVNESNIKKVNENIINLLECSNVSNIDTIKLNNGYSTTAYTGMYDIHKAGDKFIDFNYNISKYDSGNYLIIGTPEIITEY